MAAASAGAEPSHAAAVEYLYHHVFLPPKLPQKDDLRIEFEFALLNVTISGLKESRSRSHGHSISSDAAIRMLQNMQNVHVDGDVNETALLKLLREIPSTGAAVPLHIGAQNAGVLINKVECGIQFDVFELSPTNEAVMTTKGRLRRSFPGAAVLIPTEDFEQAGLQATIAHTLSNMSRQAVAGMQPQARKAGSSHDEDRDTTHPGIVSELFMGFLSVVGKVVASPRISKNTREEVFWDHCRSPWRRSPKWLLIRVALQLTLARPSYKEIMILVMGKISSQALKLLFPTDILYAMNAKLSRRLLKIGSDINATTLCHIEDVVQKVSDTITKRWTEIRQQESCPLDLAQLAELQFERDCLVSIPALDEHIDAMKARQADKRSTSFVPSSGLTKFPKDDLPSLPSSGFVDRNYGFVTLQSFEEWVATHRQTWIPRQSDVASTCDVLGTLIKDYRTLAKPYYHGNPEFLSNMYLTILELWMSCDIAAVKTCPLLQDYMPGLQHDMLQSLILPAKMQMKRLRHVEDYISARQSSATFASPKLYTEVDTQDCFAVRYFDSSPQHRTILKQITEWAEQKKQDKLNEFRKLKEEHSKLMRDYANAECAYAKIVVDTFNNYTEERHRHDCKRCGYLRKAEALPIHAHEWPLPSNGHKAKTIVFELAPPAVFASWRDTTLNVLLNVLQAEYLAVARPRASYELFLDTQLKAFAITPKPNRISLLSQDKPHLVTHRKARKVSTATEGSICLQNGLNYMYYDSNLGSFVGALSFTGRFAASCTYQLLSRSKALQRYLWRPVTSPDGPSPNTVIADQSQCPEHMSLEEFKDLAVLPLGHKIQMYNLLLQLAAPSIDFKKDEAALIVFQCIYQAGPCEATDSALRAAHAVVDDEDFANCLLDTLSRALQKVKENWESAQALAVFSTVTARLLSLTSSVDIKRRCISGLKALRTVTFGWFGLLRTKTQEAIRDEDRIEFHRKSVELALICGLSFDVEEGYLQQIMNSCDDGSMLIQCSIAIQEGKQTFQQTSEPTLALLNNRFQRLLYRAYALVKCSQASLNDAIGKAWSAYCPGKAWRVITGNADHWVVTETAPNLSGTTLTVHYNTLNGELLVSGLPLGRPPGKYEAHPMWSTLFGQSALEVMPSPIQGMHFSAKREYQGHHINFALVESSGSEDLIVSASKGSNTFETIPARLVQAEFPESFGNEFVHWYNYENDTIEFRPVDNLWDGATAAKWTLSRLTQESAWCLSKGGNTVVGARSKTTALLGSILSPLVKKPRVHIFLEHGGKVVEVDIPCLHLGFFITPGEQLLHSREFRGMHVDANQSFGTLVGLTNKLVLRPSSAGNRLVLLPEGDLTYTATRGHISVDIYRNSVSNTHTLRIDDQLGRMIDNGSLQGRLYIAYLHALTSFCLPDPLTGKTGTEQALSILRSATVKSFDELSEQNVKTLKQLADICPTRCFYPANERVMQTVGWSPQLTFLSQHAGIFKACMSILDLANQTKLFYPDSRYEEPKFTKVDRHLLERDAIRSSTFRVSGFGAEDHTPSFDVIYHARDANQSSCKASDAHILSKSIYNKVFTRHWKSPTAEQLWRKMSDVWKMNGPDHEMSQSILKYRANLVNSGFDYSTWPALHRLLRDEGAAKINKFSVMIWLSALAASPDADMEVLQLLSLMYTDTSLAQVALPDIQSCEPREGYQVTQNLIRSIVRADLKSLEDSPQAQLPMLPGEKWNSFRVRRDRLFSSNSDVAIENIVNELHRQWPCDNPSVQDMPSEYVRVQSVMAAAKVKFQLWFDNLQLFNYLRNVEVAASGTGALIMHPPRWSRGNISGTVVSKGFISSADLFYGSAPILSDLDKFDPDSKVEPSGNEQPRSLSCLIDVLEMSSCNSRYEKSYAGELRDSLASLEKREVFSSTICMPSPKSLHNHLDRCKGMVSDSYDRIISSMRSAPAVTQELVNCSSAFTSKQWPRYSPSFLLQQLTRVQWSQLHSGWRTCIVQYGLALAALQRAERLVKAASSDNTEDLVKELENVGHTNWDPSEYPESLLLEVESGIMIRPVQEEIAAEMRIRSGGNKVMQLNMGEGKSSVIVPIVAAALADTTQLVRVVVAKPQSKQMVEMLKSKLGGLLDRRVYHMPFSRALQLNKREADSIRKLMDDCMSQGGVLLILPEHILSFKLMGLECYNSNKQDVGQSLMRTQDFFDNLSRDIVDESDEIFSTEFELIYTMGTQRSTEHSPNRWICVQQVLDLVRKIVSNIANDLLSSIELDNRNRGGFPRTRLLRSDGAERLLRQIALQICETGIDGFPIARQSVAVRGAVLKYLTNSDLTDDEIDAVEHSSFFIDATKPTLFLLRGLLAGGVLAFCLGQKRWRVNYGLVSTRNPPTQLAVPYRAKDNPTPRSEFSHPDVVIVLTSLSYYYGGLHDEHLFAALEHLMQSDQADVEYCAWISDAPTMPSAFHQLEGINLRDRPQCMSDVFPHLRYGKGVVDYFLSHIVFPKHMKEFPDKLSASRWDIGKTKSRPTTGFSGTNDSRKLLPLDVTQLDLPDQKHTNALVLTYLLRPENSVVRLPRRHDTSVSDAEQLLELVIGLDPSTQVILDCGAQVLELTNVEVARAWLRLYPNDTMQAVVFVNDEDEVSVLDRRGRLESLQTSSFASQLDRCLIYLDEAHTRGIDLKLPKYYRAAVTLGANLTKDRLVQACMRMRKLGKGQAVVFCVTEEIEMKIYVCTKKQPGGDICVADIIHWAITETFAETRRAKPLWAVQGSRCFRHEELWNESLSNGNTAMTLTQAGRFLEGEAQSIEERYRPSNKNAAIESHLHTSMASRVTEIEKSCEEFEGLQFNSSMLQEEQERELSPEMEQERQVQRSHPAQPAEHSLAMEVKQFVTNGTIKSTSQAYVPAFKALSDTSIAKHFMVSQLADEHLLVSFDFARTVKKTTLYVSDSYQRPVQWVLSRCSKASDTVTHLMVVSPWEAQQLLPVIGTSSYASLHLYKPRCNAGHPSLDRLDFITIPNVSHTIPRSLLVQLDLFAGQLYLTSYEDYLEACKFLGLAADLPKDNEEVAADGFIRRDSNGQAVSGTSPVKFLQMLMSNIRRNGQAITKTHVGSMLEGKLLKKEVFE